MSAEGSVLVGQMPTPLWRCVHAGADLVNKAAFRKPLTPRTAADELQSASCDTGMTA